MLMNCNELVGWGLMKVCDDKRKIGAALSIVVVFVLLSFLFCCVVLVLAT